jgi:hypothetical protein
MNTIVDRDLDAMQTCACCGVGIILHSTGTSISLRMRADIENPEAGFPRRPNAKA